MVRQKAAPLIAVVVVAALAAGGYYLWSQRDATSETGAVIVSGTVDADQVQVTSLVGGRITAAALTEGDVVEAGVTLYGIDDRALKLQVEQAAAGVRAARAAYEEARDDDVSEAEIAAAKARWEQARAAEGIARIQLGYARVSAPATGTVSAVALQLGELASPGRTLATITRTDSLFIRAFVPEPQIGKVAIGDRALLLTDAGQTVDARVTFIASEAQFTPSNVETQDQRAKLVYEIRLKPTGTDGLTAGMPVTVTVGQ
jgi:HlyD family secretion protein